MFLENNVAVGQNYTAPARVVKCRAETYVETKGTSLTLANYSLYQLIGTSTTHSVGLLQEVPRLVFPNECVLSH